MVSWVTQLISEFRQEQQKWAELKKHKQRMRASTEKFCQILISIAQSESTRRSYSFKDDNQYPSLQRTDHKYLLKSPKPMSKRQTKGWTWKERCIFYVPVIFKLKSLDIFNRHGKETYLALLSNCRRKLYQKNNVACSVFIWFHLAFQFYFGFVSFSLFYFFLNNHHVLVIHISHQHRNKSCKYNTTKWPSLLIDMPNG